MSKCRWGIDTGKFILLTSVTMIELKADSVCYVRHFPVRNRGVVEFRLLLLDGMTIY